MLLYVCFYLFLFLYFRHVEISHPLKINKPLNDNFRGWAESATPNLVSC
jgi:hypothetical protein